MNKFIIPLLVLFTSSFAISGEIQVNNSKNISYSKQHTEHWDKKPWQRSVSDNSYRKFQTEAMKARYEGYLSKQTVSATVEAQVSRKAVLSGAFGLVKAGARLGLKAAPYVGAALFAWDAYQAVKSALESEGYEYNDASGEFLKVYKNALCMLDEKNCFGIDSSVMRALAKGGKSEKDAQTLIVMKAESEFKKYFDSVVKPNEPELYFKNCFWLDGVSCELSNGRRYGYYLKNNDYIKTLTEDEFLKIATSVIDGNPTPFVEGNDRPEYKENIKVPAGTVVTIGPITPENGKPVQVTITFGQDSNGNTTAEVATTQRPDLTPGGSEAPNTKPDLDPKPNPDGKPDKKPDDKPDSDDKPDPDDDPSDKDKRKEDKKDDKKEESKGLLCDFFPDILACDKMGKPEEGMFDAISIPQTTDDSTWSSDDFLPPNGVCPQPKSFNIWGKPVQISYEPLCVFMEKVRFAVLLGFIIMSAFIVFGSLRK